MKKLIRIFSTITLLHVFCLSGCCHTPQGQEDWHRRLMSASQMTTKLVVEEEPLFLENQLSALIGEPDFVVTPVELEELLVDEPSHRERVMSELCTEYCRGRRGLPLFECRDSCINGKWNEDIDFKDCVLWLYDESMHFSKPFRHGCRGCAQVGFICEVFVVKDSKIIASHPITFWKTIGGE